MTKREEELCIEVNNIYCRDESPGFGEENVRPVQNCPTKRSAICHLHEPEA